ncbi:DUF1254 domain-containing protein [Pseudomonas sp. NCHU5208]|uniref:DUF1254 domain-containing protein n=1 Tax=unclassified Pseudomonas TaxID=196821 RepID=UPI003F99034D
MKKYSKAALLITTLSLIAQPVMAAATTTVASMGYIYGFPLVLMGETRNGLTGSARSCTLGADLNTFTNVFDIPNKNFQAVVRPNVDTLYTSAMLDLSQGPVMLDMPAVSDRYVLMALLDAWSNNFAGVGTQSHGANEGHYFITGPNWRQASVPQGYIQIPAPTNLVWIIGRTEVKGESDIAAVHDIQRQYKLTTYNGNTAATTDVDCVEDQDRTPPIDVVKSLNGEEFFSRLSQLMKENPPPQDERWIEKSLATIGVGRFAEKDVSDLSRLDKKALDAGIKLGQLSIDQALKMLGLNGWGPDPEKIPLGSYGHRYFVRAVVAQIGFGANKNEYAVYQNAERDSNRERLSGVNHYVFTLKGDDLPPVDAFWSLTLYGDDGFLRDNDAAALLGPQVYALGSNNDLVADENGDIHIHISAIPPAGVPLSNWLPAPPEKFQLTLRFYAPQQAILKNEWNIPEVVKQ